MHMVLGLFLFKWVFNWKDIKEGYKRLERSFRFFYTKVIALVSKF